MAFVQMEPGFTRHAKRMRAGAAANWLWMCALDYTVQYMTDGYLLDVEVHGLPGYAAHVWRKVEDVGSVMKLADGRWYLHDWERYQRPSSAVKAEQDSSRARAKASYERRRAASYGPHQEQADRVESQPRDSATGRFSPSSSNGSHCEVFAADTTAVSPEDTTEEPPAACAVIHREETPFTTRSASASASASVELPEGLCNIPPTLAAEPAPSRHPKIEERRVGESQEEAWTRRQREMLAWARTQGA